VRDCDISVTLKDAGDGFTSNPPWVQGCRGASYTLTLGTQDFEYSLCDTTVSPPVARTGKRTLLKNEYQTLLENLETIAVSTVIVCGSDKETIAMTVAFPDGMQDYADDFYSCRGGGVTYVANIDSAFDTASTLARQ
jgi:hypothetical protein